jgi:hypothetical protein
MKKALLFSVGLLAGGCATLGATAGGSTGLPSANMGPFRPLEKTEVLGIAPFVLDGAGLPYREPAALPVDPANAASPNVYLYVVATAMSGTTTHDVLVRTRADDARSFYGTALDDLNGSTAPALVLSATLPWEGQDLTGPSALYVGSRIFLYYAAAGGIGLAQSTDGLHFVKVPTPVLTPDPAVHWETTTPSAPSVAVLPNGTFDMMYSAGLSIGEATSTDGLHFARVDADPKTAAIDPVLSPLPAPPGSLVVGDGGDAGNDGGVSVPFDIGQVSDPCIVAAVTPAGRLDIRVLYTGYDGLPTSPGRHSAIGLAARYGTSGPLVRQPDVVFSIDLHEAAPTYFAWSLGEMLYVHANSGGGLGSAPYPAIAAGFAPAEVMLSTPTGYASSP